METTHVIKKKDKEYLIEVWQSKDPPLMDCGHTAMSLWRLSDKDQKGLKTEATHIWSCVMCDCKIINDNPPNLEGRTARCSYFDGAKPRRRYANDECNYGCRGNAICQCGSVKSDFSLAFFEYIPNKEQDKFYCGCHGWD